MWSDGNTNANRTDFCVGKYQLTITDANGCTALIQKHFGKNLKSGEQEDALAFELLIAPNPGNGIVNLNVETWSSQTLDFKITDLIGKALYQQQLNAEIGASTIPMDFSGLPAGIYFLNLRNGSVSKNIKYVKN